MNFDDLDGEDFDDIDTQVSGLPFPRQLSVGPTWH